MRIGMILDSPFPPDYRVEKEALTLINNGHEVVLFCLTHDKPFFEETYKGVKLAHYPFSTFEYKLSALAYTVPFYHWMMRSKIADFIKRYSPDVLHVHDMVIAESVLSLVKKVQIKVVLDLHENRPASMSEYRHLQKIPGKWFINLKHWQKKQLQLVNRADKVIVVTQLAKDDLLSSTAKNEDDIIVIPNTSTDAFREHPLQPDILKQMKHSFNLLYIGDTSIRRGTADVLYAVDVLRNEIPHLMFWVIGTSSADKELKEIVHQLKIEDYVRFEGWQPENLFASYITGSHVCLSPLRRNPHHDTTFANKIFQYMSMQRPLVVSDCPAQAQLVASEHCGLVHGAANVQDLAQKILDLYYHPELRTRLGEKAKVAVEERWNWDKTSTTLVKLYNALSSS